MKAPGRTFHERTIVRLLPPVLLATALAWLALRIVVPYARNPLTIWDAPGHLFSCWFLSESLFPDYTGWNPWFFLGQAQNEGYPPLFSWLVALVARALPVEAAFRCVVSAAVLALPLAAYALGRSLGLPPRRSAVSAVAVTALLALARRPVGGNLYSTIYGGLVSHALAFPLFLLFPAVLRRGLRTGRAAPAGALLGAVAVANTMAFVATGAFAAAFAIAALPARRARALVARVFLWGGLLGAFWIVPLLLSRHTATAGSVGDFLRPWEQALILGVLLALWAVRRQRASRRLRPLALFLALALAAEAAVARGLLENLPLHFYRIREHLLVLLPFLAWPILDALPSVVRAVFPFAAVGALLLAPVGALQAAGRPLPPLPHLPDGPGRVWVLTNRRPTHHAPAPLLVRASGRPGVKGLFVESAPLAPRIFEMEQLLLGPYPDRVPFDWGGLAWGRPAILQGMGFLRRADRLRLLGVDTVCTDLPIQEEGLEIAGRRVDHGFTVYRLPDCPLVEPIRETPRIATGSWSREVLAWYLGTETRLLLDRAVAAAPAGQGEAVEEWSVSPRGDRIRFLTRGRAAPYLVKTAWHRNWRAWVEGRPAPIAQAAPGLMVVSGAGRFELRYGRSAPDLAALALSGAALAAWLVRTILHRPGRPGTSRRPRDGRVRPSRPFSHPPSPPI